MKRCIIKMGYFLGLMISFLSCIACTRHEGPPTLEEQIMVKETLDQTSPRAENNQPKAIPEFKFTFGGSKKRRPVPTEEDAVSDRDIMLDNS